MNFKKLIAAAMSLCITSAVSVPYMSFADDKTGTKMADSIVYAKSVFEIPSSYSEFDSNTSSKTLKNGNVINIYEMTWTDEKNNSSISITVDDNNNIIEYSNYKRSNDEKNQAFSDYSNDDMLKTASEFMNKVMPKYTFKSAENTDNGYGNYKSFEFLLYENNLPVTNIGADVEINIYTNEVVSYYLRNYEFVSSDFPPTENIISLDDAKKAYIEKIPFEPEYKSYYNYKDKKLSIFAAYEKSFSNRKAIDAFTGNIKEYEPNGGYDFRNAKAYDVKESMADTGSGDSLKQLTPEELNSVEKLSNMISNNDALNIIIKYCGLSSNNTKMSSSRIYKDTIDTDKYIWDISFDGDNTSGNGRVNAKTGELISFYRNNRNIIISSITTNDTDTENEKNNKNNYEEKAAKFLNEVVSDKFKNTKADFDDSNDNSYSRNYTYTRIVNGIKFRNNYLNVNFDENGDLVRFESRWYDTAKFPSIDNIKTGEEIFNIACEQNNFGPMYLISSETPILIYDFRNTENMMWDAKTGKKIKYDGTEYKKINSNPQYIDIEGHECAESVTKLLSKGLFINDGTNEFKPDKEITIEEFFQYCLNKNSIESDELKEYLIENKFINPTDKMDSIITFQQAARFIIRANNYTKMENFEIFKSANYNDTVDNNFLAAIVICDELGLIEPDSNNNINADKKMTRSDAAQFIYKALLKDML